MRVCMLCVKANLTQTCLQLSHRKKEAAEGEKGSLNRNRNVWTVWIGKREVGEVEIQRMWYSADMKTCLVQAVGLWAWHGGAWTLGIKFHFEQKNEWKLKERESDWTLQVKLVLSFYLMVNGVCLVTGALASPHLINSFIVKLLKLV